MYRDVYRDMYRGMGYPEGICAQVRVGNPTRKQWAGFKGCVPRRKSYQAIKTKQR